MSFAEIKPEDFETFTPGQVATYIKIEQRLNELGGGGDAGVKFKRSVMKAAGWPHTGLTGYAKNPKLAASAFNQVRLILEQTSDKDELLKRLSE